VTVTFNYALTGDRWDWTMVTITDKRSNLQVHERTFPLAADAFIAAAKRMRLP
jgi:hypothetical protein